MRILPKGKHINRLDGLQSTSLTKQLAESAVQSFMQCFKPIGAHYIYMI
jgi:hypothetical protein